MIGGLNVKFLASSLASVVGPYIQALICRVLHVFAISLSSAVHIYFNHWVFVKVFFPYSYAWLA